MGTLQKTSSVSVEVAATPEQVWALLVDISRAGEWSHENQGGEWVDGATGPAVGARFRGKNENGRNRWSRLCEVLEVDEPRRISWRTVPKGLYMDSTRWSYEIEPAGEGCRVIQRYEILKLNPVLDRVLYAIMPAHRDRSEALAGDLKRLGEMAALSR